MERTAAEVRAEIARLEQKLASMSQPAKSTSKVAQDKSASRKILAEIDELDEQIAGMYASDDDDADDAEKTARTAAEDDEEAFEASDDDDADDEEGDDDDAPEAITSSEEEKDIEDEITQDKFKEVERTRPAGPATSGPSMLSVAPTKYTARLQQASVRLDRVAAYLEKHGKVKLAFRIDKIADAIDTQLKQATKSEAK
jgi:hypothetical protein